MRGPVARETARRFIICKSGQIGDSESELPQKGKNSGESKLAEKLYYRRKAVPAGLCAQGREEAIISPSLSLRLSPSLPLSREVVNPYLSLSSHKSGVQAELPDRTNKHIYTKKKSLFM